MNIIVIAVCALVLGIFGPKGTLAPDSGAFSVAFVLWALIGAWLGTAVRLLPPRTAHVITFLGTHVIGVIKTGISLTLPWPFGWTHAVVKTDVRHLPFKLQIKARDELVFDLPGSIQYQVIDAKKFSIERADAIKQMEEIVIPSIRSTASSIDFQDVYGDKGSFRQQTEGAVSDKLASFGLKIIDLVVQDPELRPSTVDRLNGIREAKFDEQAARHNANATFERMVGEARAEAESMRLKGEAFKGFRLLAAEGNAGAIAVMQGKLGIIWEDKTIGEGDLAKIVKVAKFVAADDPLLENGAQIPEVDIDPSAILEFLRVIDSNDAIRDAAAKPGTVIIAPAGGSSNFGDMAALTKALAGQPRQHANGADRSAVQ